jgi:hypothetical protein
MAQQLNDHRNAGDDGDNDADDDDDAVHRPLATTGGRRDARMSSPP